jgi:acetyl esterase
MRFVCMPTERVEQSPEPAADVQALLETFREQDIPKLNLLTVEQARAFHESVFVPATDPEPVGAVENRDVRGPTRDIPVRIYKPEGSGPFPVLVFFHGGGWVLGNLDTHDSMTRALSARSDCMVVATDYRRAPEYRFPAAIEDAYTVTRWVANNAAEIGANGERLAVGGGSAGGNLAAAVAQMARDKSIATPSIDYQLLMYPALDHTFETISYQQNATGYYLTEDQMAWFWNHYLPAGVGGRNSYASPLKARDFTGLPPAFVMTCGYDPLRDEGAAYAERLEEAGIAVEHVNYEGMIHDFVNMRKLKDPYPDIARADDALDQAGAALYNALKE